MSKDALGAFDVDAELRFLFARGGLCVGARVDVGVDADRADRLLAELAGNPIDVFEFFFALDVERGDACLDAHLDLFIGLADAGEDDLFRVATGLQRAEQFAGAGDVEAASFGREQLEDVQVAAAFDRVADRRVDRRKRVGELAVMAQEGRL